MARPRQPARIQPRRLTDLRGPAVRTLSYPVGDVLVVSGLPGGGKSTLMLRAKGARLIDSQDVRLRWAARLPQWLPYAVYRPLVRIAHYAGMRRALRSGDSVVVHDCGTLPWVRNWLARQAAGRGRGMHLLVLDVSEEAARDGQRSRGRGVSAYAMTRHRKATRRLLAAARAGKLPAACVSAVVLDRAAARALGAIAFDCDG
ncbi:AAA family ATPase [Actinacidiphila soli]|jgi:predicted kinase|uniref:AAA family ATPase n=1 Tax=Actinacidiphila soli TaxID=2487275 RepID=UPI000FCA5D9A|nr:AAA family ATPase [Actinacidiphila soli]